MWVTLLDAADYDPLLAQEIDEAIGWLPEPMLKAVMVASHNDPVRAKMIVEQCNQVWWERWLKVMELRADVGEN